VFLKVSHRVGTIYLRKSEIVTLVVEDRIPDEVIVYVRLKTEEDVIDLRFNDKNEASRFVTAATTE
jgi:hypothetical protein